MRVKSVLLTSAALVASGHIAYAADDRTQTPDTPAAETKLAPQPTVQEELVYLREVLAVQALRLDEAEQSLERQQQLISLQEQKITVLQAELNTANSTLVSIAGSEGYAAASAAAASSVGSHVVKRGDTLYSIAKSMGVSVDALARSNNIRRASEISVGQTINNPNASARLASVASTPQTTLPKIETPQSAPAPKQEPAPQRVASNNNNQPAPGPQEDPNIQDRAINQQRRREEPQQGLPTEVGVRPEEEEEAPYLALFSDVAGILTPKGTLYAEPSVTFTASSDNRFFFEGVEIIDAILIGAIEATDIDRIAVTENLGLRYGLTNRLELDASLPYVYREDRIAGVAIDDRTQIDNARFGNGIGDVGFGLHYQLNKGEKWPYLIANVRAKAPTGTGPFEVERAPNGQELALATGSGFWSVEPSLSFILPSDPAVIFGNIGYQKNFSTVPDNVLIGTGVSEEPADFTGPPDPDTMLPTALGIFQREQTTQLLEFNPGDAITASLGVGLSLNERLSVNFGYDHRYFLRTRTAQEITTVERNLTLDREVTGEETLAPEIRILRQEPTTVGSFLFGGSYAVNNRTRLNLSTSFGATDEAPDFRVSLRAQIKLHE